MRLRPTTSLAVCTILTAGALAGCFGPQDSPQVLGTFYPTTFLAEAIAGDLLTVGSIVPAGHEPHDWEATPRDVARLGDAKLVIAQSRGFEPWLQSLVSGLGAGAPPVVYTAADIDADDDGHDEGEQNHPEDEGEHDDRDEGHDHGADPHTWLDPVLFRQQADAAFAGFVAAFPHDEGELTSRATILADRIDAVHADYGARLADCRTDTFVTLHAAYGLLADRYGLHMESVMGLSPEAEPSAAVIDHIIKVVRDNNITIVFTEPGAGTRVMETIAEETDAEVRVLDPIEVATGLDWTVRMRVNLDLLSDALGCSP